MHADFVALLHAAIDAHVRTRLRLAQVFDEARRRQKTARRILRVNTRLDRMPFDGQLFLGQRQRFACGDPQLPFDQIEAGDHLGDRMLDLQPCVHFHEIKAAALLGDEFHGSRADVAHRFRRFNCRFTHLFAAFLAHARRRRFLENLLMAALHRTVAFEQVQAGAMHVGEHLHFDVPRAQEIFFDQYPVIAERRGRLPLRRSQCLGELARLAHDAHAFATPAGRGLDQHRIADAPGFFCQLRGILCVAVIARYQRHTGLLHQHLRRRFRAHRFYCGGRRPDERDTGPLAGAREVGVLGKKSVARMNCPGAALFRDIKYAIATQVGLARMRRAD